MTIAPVQIRAGRLNDAAAMAGLMQQLGYPTTLAEMLERLRTILAQAEYATLVAECEGRVVGIIGLRLGHYYEHTGQYGQILALVVDQQYRGQQIGATLIATGEQWLCERGARAVIVNSGRTRAAAHRFYERHSYAATGLRFVKGLSPAPS